MSSSWWPVIFIRYARNYFGDGIPYGMLPSGLSFSQLSCLWTREYWGGGECEGKELEICRFC